MYANSWSRVNRNVRGGVVDRLIKYQDRWIRSKNRSCHVCQEGGVADDTVRSKCAY